MLLIVLWCALWLRGRHQAHEGAVPRTRWLLNITLLCHFPLRLRTTAPHDRRFDCVHIHA